MYHTRYHSDWYHPCTIQSQWCIDGTGVKRVQLVKKIVDRGDETGIFPPKSLNPVSGHGCQSWYVEWYSTIVIGTIPVPFRVNGTLMVLFTRV